MLVGCPPFYDEDPMTIYNQILSGNYEIPQELDIYARQLITALLQKDPAKRIGDAVSLKPNNVLIVGFDGEKPSLV